MVMDISSSTHLSGQRPFRIQITLYTPEKKISPRVGCGLLNEIFQSESEDGQEDKCEIFILLACTALICMQLPMKKCFFLPLQHFTDCTLPLVKYCIKEQKIYKNSYFICCGLYLFFFFFFK